MGKGTDLDKKGKRSKPEFWNDNKTDGDAQAGLGLKRGGKAGTPTPAADLGRKGSRKS